MKVGRLVYDKKQGEMTKNVFCNYGDNVQTLALDTIITEMFPKEQIVDINIYDLPMYAGDEYVLLPINANFWTCDELYFLPASDKIIPVFTAVSFQIPPTSPKAITYLKKWEPIGCRDYETLMMMRDLGIESYLNGCVTLTLPKREVEPKQKKIFLVGLSDKVVEKLPDEILKYAEVVDQIVYYDDDWSGRAEITDNKAKQLYKRYHDEATMIITSKLHCASPCMAMGIPTIIIREKKSCRFEWINKLTEVYTIDDMQNINWSPQALDFEDLKDNIRNIITRRISEVYEKYLPVLKVSEFFESCEHEEALSVTEQIVKAVRSSGKKQYIIWGVGGYLANAIYQILEEKCPDVELAGAIDEYKDCTFHGFQTRRSQCLQEWKDKFVIVTTATGTPDAVEYMNSLGFEAWKDYYTFSMIN